MEQIMKKAQYGDFVKVQYTVTLESGSRLIKKDMMHFIIGSNDIPKDIEHSVIGMKIGNSKRIKIPGHRIFGPYSAYKIMEIGLNKLPKCNPEPGVRIKIPGVPHSVKVVNVTKTKVTVDTNHPLTKEVLMFSIKLLDITFTA
jgi:peptidylprolyl isomerase